MYEESINKTSDIDKNLDKINQQRQKLICAEKQIQKKISNNDEKNNRNLLFHQAKTKNKNALGIFFLYSFYNYIYFFKILQKMKYYLQK